MPAPEAVGVAAVGVARPPAVPRDAGEAVAVAEAAAEEAAAGEDETERGLRDWKMSFGKD